jgi:bifunctional UDP-N-acetylglucosamine pyrophosphorylase / glucosamine-1-phosphate N-acetyltransferase
MEETASRWPPDPLPTGSRLPISYHRRVAAPVVVILAAGQGTRMRSETPKLLHPLCGRPMIAWSVAAAKAAGAGRVVVVQSPGRELDAALGDGVAVAIQEQPRGTADAVRAAVGHLGDADAVVVMNGDHPLISPDTIRELLEAHARSGAAATIATAVLEDPGGYGRVIRAPDGTVERVVETKRAGDASASQLHVREVNTGLFAFDGPELAAALEQVRADNAQGELYLPDVLPILRAHERTVQAHEVGDPGTMQGINDRVQLAQARAMAQRTINEGHMRAGATIVDPQSAVIDVAVQIEPDAVIAPFTNLHGQTSVGAGATVGPLSTLIDCQVGPGARVVHSYATGAEIAERVSVGPFAYLRPGTVLRAGAKAGTFVEIKNSTIGAGSKVPHLSYIGDAEVGEGTNLGAATITANYDGTRKHRTKIGDRVKTSVDTTLVAPVTVGDDAFTGAGSVITKDVPPGALGIARERQRNVEGYTERRKEREEGADGPQDEESRLRADVNSGGA